MSHQCVLMRQEQQTLGNSLGFRGLHLFHTGQKTHLHLLTSGFWMQCEYILYRFTLGSVDSCSHHRFSSGLVNVLIYSLFSGWCNNVLKLSAAGLFVAVYIIQAATEVKDIKKVSVCSFRVVLECATCQRSERSDEFNSWATSVYQLW